MRVALVHDWLTGLRGGERVLHELACLYPDADLYTLVHVPGSTTSAIEALRIRASPLSRLPGIARHYRKLLPLFPWAIRRFDLSGYDLVVSCSHAVAKSVRVPPGTPHLCYCLTPMRYVWDQRDAYLGRGPKRLLSKPLVAALRRFDRETSGPQHVTRFAAISTTVQQRIARHYGRQASCVFPPVRTDEIVPNGREPKDQYLLVAGFVPYKREQIAIEAFRRLGRPLIVAGDGPDRAKLARNAPANIRFLGRVSDAELADLFASCRALVYPQEEDFGLVAVEAQAAGRPVIAFARGGALDTVRDVEAQPLDAPGRLDSQATGILFEPQTVGGLMAAVERFESMEDRFDPDVIRSWATRFGIECFREGIQREVALTLEDHRNGPPS